MWEPKSSLAQLKTKWIMTVPCQSHPGHTRQTGFFKLSMLDLANLLIWQLKHMGRKGEPSNTSVCCSFWVRGIWVGLRSWDKVWIQSLIQSCLKSLHLLWPWPKEVTSPPYPPRSVYVSNTKLCSLKWHLPSSFNGNKPGEFLEPLVVIKNSAVKYEFVQFVLIWFSDTRWCFPFAFYKMSSITRNSLSI